MKIDNEFGVDAPVERAWAALTDLEGLAPCMPGAELTGVEGEVYRGKVKVKVGPVISQFSGTARFVEKDEADRSAVISATGKDARGGGNASATIRARLRPDGTGTRVTVSTDLTISGKLAQFGSGMIKEISEKLLGQFAHNLEAQLHAAPPAEGAGPAAAGASARPAPPEAASEPGPAAAIAPEAPRAAPVAPPVAAAVADGATDPADATATQSPAPAKATTAATASEAATGTATGTAPLDLMELAGSSVYKRLVPVVAVVLVAVGAVIWLLVG